MLNQSPFLMNDTSLSNNIKRAIIALALFAVSFFAGISAQAAEAAPYAEGVKCYQAGRYVLAAAYFRAHISNSPAGNAAAYYYLANCCVKMNQMEDAHKYFSHALELNPSATLKSYCQAALASLPYSPAHQAKA